VTFKYRHTSCASQYVSPRESVETGIGRGKGRGVGGTARTEDRGVVKCKTDNS
jgi:hypothetical protein